MLVLQFKSLMLFTDYRIPQEFELFKFNIDNGSLPMALTIY